MIRKATATSPIQIYYVHADHLNTPRVIVNTANTIIWRWENTHPFGANLPDEDPDGNAQLFEYHPRFPGQYFDRETNLHYNYFRYYEPETGRYVSPDPIGLEGGLNIYGYVEQNPLSLIDPTGEAPPIIAGIITATVAACRAAISAIPTLFSKHTKNVIDEKRVRHIFRSKRGHFSNTTKNRKLLESVANNPSTTLGKDKFGNIWSAQTRPDGTQVWTQMRGGKIINGGINQAPRQFNSETGLASSIKPGQ